MKRLPKIVYEYVTDYHANQMTSSNRYHYALKGNAIYRIVMIEKLDSPKLKKGWSPLTHKCTAILIEENYDYFNDNNKFCFTEFPKHKTEQLDSIKTFVLK